MGSPRFRQIGEGVAECKMSQPQSSDWLMDSRGETRTRDSGIMSENVGPPDRNSTSDDAA
jgi:hypothetical protein